VRRSPPRWLRLTPSHTRRSYTVSVFLGLCENASLKQKEGIALCREEPFGDVF
jgi:hypothetical protein